MKITGMIHLETLPGYPNHKGIDFVIAQAIKDAKALIKGGVDAILIENTEDDPHRKYVSQEVISAFTLVAKEVKDIIDVPLGICVLWNDYKASLAIAKNIGAKFVRIPVFTEAVLTSSGIIEGCAYEAIDYRHKINADDIKILADIQIKHAANIIKRPISESAIEALHFGADQVIITGRFTGDAPSMRDVIEVRKACPNSIIVVGSGLTLRNLNELSNYVNVAIVGTSFKRNKEIIVEKVKQITSKAHLLK